MTAKGTGFPELLPLVAWVRLQPLRRVRIVISSELGMRPLMERVLSRREILRA